LDWIITTDHGLVNRNLLTDRFCWCKLASVTKPEGGTGELVTSRPGAVLLAGTVAGLTVDMSPLQAGYLGEGNGAGATADRRSP
jgi:hypothetical protein